MFKHFTFLFSALFLLFFSQLTLADWVYDDTVTGYVCVNGLKDGVFDPEYSTQPGSSTSASTSYAVSRVSYASFVYEVGSTSGPLTYINCEPSPGDSYGEGYHSSISVYRWDSTEEPTDPQWEGYTFVGPSPDDYDDECSAIKPDYVTLPVDPGLGFSWQSGGCSFSTSDVVPCLETPSGEYSCNVTTAEALEVEPEIVDEPVPVDGRDSTQEYTETTDPAADCPFSNVTWDGTSYCYNGPDADQGAEYADTSTRVNHYDGSYTVTDAEGNSQTYNPDGSPTGTASYDPGAGPGTGDLGCPAWICSAEGVPDGGEGDGSSGSGGPPGLPVVTDDFSQGIDWDSGLATTGSCPAPYTVPLSFGGYSDTVEFSYQGFCDFASVIRALVLAAAYISSAFLVYRGIMA